MEPFIALLISTGAFHREGSRDIYIHHRRGEDVFSKVLKKVPQDLSCETFL
jgi:hypothetical protein